MGDDEALTAALAASMKGEDKGGGGGGAQKRYKIPNNKGGWVNLTQDENTLINDLRAVPGKGQSEMINIGGVDRYFLRTSTDGVDQVNNDTQVRRRVEEIGQGGGKRGGASWNQGWHQGWHQRGFGTSLRNRIPRISAAPSLHKVEAVVGVGRSHVCIALAPANLVFRTCRVNGTVAKNTWASTRKPPAVVGAVGVVVE